MDYEIVLPSNTRVVSEEENKGVYEIDGLYPGYGNTLGSSLRRILLSSLPGAAVTKVKIEGASHEFSTVSGVLEDIMTIILNLKQLRFQIHGDEPQTATIEVKGAREVKGKDIKCPTQLEVKNKDHHIATLTDKNASFSVELTVERGLGFVTAENLVKDKVAVGSLILDAIFTPIRRANYEIENMRVGDRTDYNRLRLFIETDGTIAPREAFKRALSIMRRQIEQIESFDMDAGEAKVKAPAAEENEAPSGFDVLKITPRIKKALLDAGISTPETLSEKTADELMSIEGIGAKAVGDIKKAMTKAGFSLRE
ncbi:DNA-directed RNA polymerase subunit alpha [Candidatus Giovannonibacteria bacterium RIFCSPHIGHO2_01_FULL_45_33]|uniref:DNA-directed RNA polymerase subunit alpha n=1 Tax=Candidatus Giovannonibacteria bacterium RIFCSPLOWO2_01_FULL_45_34 TaxID=1798351 RepID=A0A1F5WYM8_9BACT|nr:MAG: DNA-directed RNA polymerase subunit alpha [Candidatus Giovannonibacteria bacterium RIFCSPHIGHO2_01_FULL_45_33]OGF70894.1 MAG: DNA-directed RNA polymerase subunit alpha [Candidatus Giovannonibacteria bacterium RIFCSPHIGHO2_02_FULL_44_11]OGF80729.1 MAG: DNA-directed RNA polymerase subunit alpha [Candidatus Giovannonibacteria bacterium RIFCSPLOWO2_01_FULL_45_34]